MTTGAAGQGKTGTKDRSTEKVRVKKANAKPGRPRAKPSVPPAPPSGSEIDPDSLEFIAALDAYRKAHGRPFPSWSEVLHVVRWLGYRKS